MKRVKNAAQTTAVKKYLEIEVSRKPGDGGGGVLGLCMAVVI